MDEAMIKFQGRSSLKQYVPFKPVKRGIKCGSLVVSFPDPQAKRREGLGDSLTSMRSGGIHGMQLYCAS